MAKEKDVIHSRIWSEEPEADNPFAAARCFCAGYDVYGEVIHKASWIEYVYLMFRGERPESAQAKQFERLAIALANPGPRDHSVRAAMNGGVGGSTSAACLMAALGVGAGQFGGAHEVALVMDTWKRCGTDIDAWRTYLANPINGALGEFWPELDHVPGFDPYGKSCPMPVRQTLDLLANDDSASRLHWLVKHRAELEESARGPLSMIGVAAVALLELGFSVEQGEILFLLLRLPGAAVHALEQREYGWRRYPFFNSGLNLTNDPGPVANVKEQDSAVSTPE